MNATTLSSKAASNFTKARQDKTNLKLLTAIVLLASGIANVGAQEFSARENAPAGKVQIVYAQVASGVFMDTRIRPAAAAQPQRLWADARPGMPMEEVSHSTMVAAKKDVNVTRRDIIADVGCIKAF